MSLLKFTLLTLAAYCLTLFFALAQTAPAGNADQLSGRIQNASGRPVAYVSIGILNTAVGTVSDEQGQFTLILKNNASTDSVRMSIIGYDPITLTVASLRQRLADNSPLVMNERVQQLAEVRIKGNGQKSIGSRRVSTSMNTNLLISGKPSQNLGSEVGRRFNLPNKTHRITQYRAYVESNFEAVTLRVNIYEASTMKPLLNRNVYVKVTGKHSNWIDVDLEPLNIVAKGDVVASVQWVGSEGKGSYLGLPIQMPTFATHLYKYGSQNKWKTFRGMSTPMTLEFSSIDDTTKPATESLTMVSK
jgi:hypothetical protein